MGPIIGIFASVDGEGRTSVLPSYAEAVEKTGGVPVLFPYTEDRRSLDRFLALCDGFLFAGGPDMDPAYYGEERSPSCGAVEEKRDTLDLEAFPRAYATGKPILGICRGAQLINVALGGTLYQDIPSELQTEIAHVQNEPKFSYSHEIRVLPATPLSALFGTCRVRVNSFHHQAIKSLGCGLSVMAAADDGVIEALYLMEKQYLRAYQWHPERLYGTDEYSQRIFRDFTEACKETRI